MKPKQNPKVILYCFPFAGGGTIAFQPWANAFGEEIEVCAIQLPGRERRMMEKPFDAIQPLVRQIAAVLAPATNRTYVFFGHSFGALVAFETARELRQMGVSLPQHLFVGARRAPQIPDPRAPIYQLPEEEFVRTLRSYNGTPEAVLTNRDLMDLFLPLLRADFKINSTYRYVEEPPFDFPITAYGGTEDHLATLEELKAWSKMTTGLFEVNRIGCGHFFIQEEREWLMGQIKRKIQAL